MSRICSSLLQDLHWAVPSCVIPGTAAANAAFLAGKVSGIGLCLFETDACLAYGPEDLPPVSAGQVNWHLHLPLDLPWERGPETVAAICGRLCAMTSHLRPMAAVLHVPEGQDNAHRRKTLARFAQMWDSGPPIALENTSSCDVLELGRDFLKDNGFNFCLDMAHAVSYGQSALLDSNLVECALVWHWSAPGDGDRHWPLTLLRREEKRLAWQLWGRARADAIHLLEVFSWDGICASLPVLEQLMAQTAEGE